MDLSATNIGVLDNCLNTADYYVGSESLWQLTERLGLII